MRIKTLSLLASALLLSSPAVLALGDSSAAAYEGIQQMEKAQTPAHAYLTQAQIGEIQTALKQRGFDPGRVDGIIGPKSSGALKGFQKREGLRATGRLDQKSLDALGLDINLKQAQEEHGG